MTIHSSDHGGLVEMMNENDDGASLLRADQPASPAATEALPNMDYEAARVRGYRAVRLLEPSMELYEAAMSVYVAAFGPHPGEVQPMEYADAQKVAMKQ